jgi:hypothetical protein
MNDHELSEQVQANRRTELRKLMDIHHSGKMGDYDDTYTEFEATYFGTVDGEPVPAEELADTDNPTGDPLPIPRYASIADDETYGMIHLCTTMTEALDSQANIPHNGEYLNHPAGIVDLDTGEQIVTRTVELTEEMYAVLCGLVQPNWLNVEPPDDKDAVNPTGIFSMAWEDLRIMFPIAAFREAVDKEIIEYEEEAGL